jgi:transcriptional regulator with XRE-family HTH domain
VDILSDRAKREIQLKLGHYLITYRKGRRLTQDEMATQLGYSLSQYKRTELGIEPRVANAVEFLAVFANLTGKTVPEFVQYLQEIPAEKRANLGENEASLLNSFNAIALDSRRDFIRHYCHDEKTKLLPLIEIANSLQSLSSTQLTLIQFFISSISNKAESPFDAEQSGELLGKVKSIIEAYEKSLKSGVSTFPTTI